MCLYLCVCADKGTTYEFRVSAKNEVDYGERAVVTIITPDGGTYITEIFLCEHITLHYISGSNFYVFISVNYVFTT